ncbi:signal peptidase I [Candidatus Margulisiibacteriota bacterium]
MFKTIREKNRQWKEFKANLKKKSFSLYILVDIVETVLVALILALIIRKYVIQTSIVPTGSMIPTMEINDRLFVNKFIYRFKQPERGDIVVFKSPYQDGKDYVKRCIGLPGDKLEIKRGQVYIDNEQLILPGVKILLVTADGNANELYKYYGPVTIPEASFFMMGDNRGNSLDSRVWGYVPKEDLLGKAVFTFWPLSRMKVLK